MKSSPYLCVCVRACMRERQRCRQLKNELEQSKWHLSKRCHKPIYIASEKACASTRPKNYKVGDGKKQWCRILSLFRAIRLFYIVNAINCPIIKDKIIQSHSKLLRYFYAFRPSLYSRKKNTTLDITLDIALDIQCRVSPCRTPPWRWLKKVETCRRFTVR